MSISNNNHTQIRIPAETVQQIDDYMKMFPYFSTRTDFVKHCIRSYIENNNGGSNKNYQKNVKDGSLSCGEERNPTFYSKMIKEERKDGKNEDENI